MAASILTPTLASQRVKVICARLFVCLASGERVLASGSVQLPRFTLLESGSLLISPSHISDAGTYTCMASNSRGIDEAAADLVVWGECVHLPHACMDAGEKVPHRTGEGFFLVFSPLLTFFLPSFLLPSPYPDHHAAAGPECYQRN